MNARQVALDVVTSVLKNKTYLNLELKRALRPEMSREDRRFITALANTAIENLYRVDYVIDQFVTAKRVHTVIKNILRLGVCQLMFFESVPTSAAVNESVKLAEQNGKKQLKGFVNATLRNIAQNLGSVEYPDEKTDLIGYLHTMYSYPEWLCEKYVKDYGAEQAEAICGYVGRAGTCVRLNEIRRKEPLQGYGPGLYCEDAYYIKHADNIENMPLFKSGEITVQGEASMVCVRAAGIRKMDHVLDACAAPGGKSVYAAQFAREGSVTALDIHEHRVGLIRNTAERLGAKNVTAVCADASQFVPEYAMKFDVVLVDAPCSALGLLYRKPDIKILKSAEDIPKLVELQKAILSNCARYVKKGGTLLYSTCTIDRQENGGNIRWFLNNCGGFEPADFKNDIPEALMARSNGSELQLFPHIDRIDGFYMSRLRKK